MLAVAAGLSLGKEGPMVHIAICLGKFGVSLCAGSRRRYILLFNYRKYILVLVSQVRPQWSQEARGSLCSCRCRSFRRFWRTYRRRSLQSRRGNGLFNLSGVGVANSLPVSFLRSVITFLWRRCGVRFSAPSSPLSSCVRSIHTAMSTRCYFMSSTTNLGSFTSSFPSRF